MTGRISDERFSELSADYEAEQKELKERAAGLQEELSKAQEATENAEKFMKVVRKHTSFEELTPTLLREFVEKIVIHESVALDGKRRGKLRRQEIEIYYSFVGKNLPPLCCGSLWRKSLSMKALPLTGNAGESYADKKSKSIILLSAR